VMLVQDQDALMNVSRYRITSGISGVRSDSHDASKHNLDANAWAYPTP
jgi:hypothetical protein